MSIKKYHKSANEAWTGWAQDFVTRINSRPIARIESIDNRNCLFFVVSAGYDDYDTKYIFSTDWKANTQYTISFEALRLTTESDSNVMQVCYTDGSNEMFPKAINSGNFESYTKTTAAGKTVKYITALYTSGNFRIDIDTFMVNEGSTPLPYEPYDPEVWHSVPYRKYGTETDTITTLPATIIGDGTPISSYIIKGNMEQNGTPTPSSPIYPGECGDLVTSGEHAGQYKLPLTLGSTTTDIYLGEVQSTRRVKKLVLTGEEPWVSKNGEFFYINVSSLDFRNTVSGLLCSHLPVILRNDFNRQPSIFWGRATIGDICLCVSNTTMAPSDFKSYLAAQYAAGTPVTVWYVLAEPTTGIVNEPIRKIGDYVDIVSGTGLATSGTAQELNIETTLKPSEVDLTYHGWHEHEDTKYST